MSFGGPKFEVDYSKDKGLTVQSERESADINTIVKRYEKTGALPFSRAQEPFYGDVSEFTGLADALIKVQDANKLFMTFPAEIRERFENDPVKMVEFLSDQKNLDEAIKLGFVDARPEIEPVPEPVSVPGAPVDAPKK